ncbi:hypothetical protein ACFSSF_09490 [Dietzia aerolata]|uniref:hypothetical protein n=1 Tax=Dietzia aerolata TaxID=595984 RepID=UPI0036346878
MRPAGAAQAIVRSARAAFAGPSGPALWRGIVGSILLTLAGFGVGALPVDGDPRSRWDWPGTRSGTVPPWR